MPTTTGPKKPTNLRFEPNLLTAIEEVQSLHKKAGKPITFDKVVHDGCWAWVRKEKKRIDRLNRIQVRATAA